METNEVSKSNKIKIIVLTFLILLVSVAGISYAYFSIQVTGNEEASSIRVSTALLKLIYTDTLVMEGRGIYPGWSQSKTISVENDGTDTVYYTIIWRDLFNEVANNELLLSMTCSSNIQGNTCEGLSSTAIPLSLTTTHNINIKENIEIEPGERHTYTVTVVFPELSTAQNYNQGKTFIGTLNIKEGQKPVQFTRVGTDSTIGLPVVRSVSNPTEEFYDISNAINYSSLDSTFLTKINYDASKSILLAKYNLYVGQTCTSSSSCTPISTSATGYGLQSADAKGYVDSSTPRVGVVPFSGSSTGNGYWYDTSTSTIKTQYGTSYDASNIYDTTYNTAPNYSVAFYNNAGNANYSIAYYVENYINVLGIDGAGRLLTLTEFNEMTVAQRTNGAYYWLGSAGNVSYVRYVGATSGDLRSNNFNHTSNYGVRPVIIVSTSDIGA